MIDFGDFDKVFETLTRHSPRPWQRELAEEVNCRNRLVRIPTGQGKTHGVMVSWIYHRLARRDNRWPRRLVWCLPMRVLVEQTFEVADTLRRNWSRQGVESEPFEVHRLMGGDEDASWFVHPERPAILVGTQDMLLSRALNRGYAAGRSRWPVEFGLLNQDCLWVMDEAQLMEVGLATSAQLQAFRDQDEAKHRRPCWTWWMSATLQPNWLHSVDTAQVHHKWVENPCEIRPDARRDELWTITKPVETDSIGWDEHKKFAKRVLQAHDDLSDSEFGKITLVVCNTVERASETFNELSRVGRRNGMELIHSRFRPAERESWRDRFLSRDACRSGVDRILVATQVVEAGVDLSAGCLVTELAPWPSLVQRFGRCARYGGTGRVLVVDRGQDEKHAAPYNVQELQSAWEAIQRLKDVGIASLEDFEAGLKPEERQRLYPYEPTHLLVRKEFDELFDTTPDLTGADLDIGRFIRSDSERDLHIFWIDVPKDLNKSWQPDANRRPHRRELCAVPFEKARGWLCDKDKLKKDKQAWVWDWLDGEWRTATRGQLLPGRIVCVANSCGGYDLRCGFNPESKETVSVVGGEDRPSTYEGDRVADLADAQHDGEPLSTHHQWKTIACHSREVADQVRAIAAALELSSELQDQLELAAWWHDWGKAHPAFQGSIRGTETIARPKRCDLAKAPDACWSKKDRYRFLDDPNEERPGFRHELASALGLFALLRAHCPWHPALLGPWQEVFETIGRLPLTAFHEAALESPPPLMKRLLDCDAETFDLVAYLVACHHGKVRVGLHAGPKDQDYQVRNGDDRGLPIRGVRNRDKLPSTQLVPDEPPIPSVTLTLAPATLGLSFETGKSWRERCIGLQDRFGPCALAFLEAILRAADARASCLDTPDPALTTEATV